MAELKSLIVNGVSRLNSNLYAKNIYADKLVINGGTSSQFLKADGTLDSTAYSPTSHTHSYLPLSGGQLTGTLLIKTSSSSWTEGIRILDASNGWTSLTLGGSANSGTGENVWSMHTYQGIYYLALNGSSTYTYGLNWTKAGALSLKTSALTNNGNTIWHAGNDGSGSGLDADLLDGNHASAFATSGHNHDSAYVSALGTSGNNLTWTKNGTTNNITVPYATSAGSASSVAWSNVSERPLYWANVALQTDSDPATGPTFLYATFTRTSNHGISVGTIRGTVVNSQTGEFIHMYDRVHIGSPSGWGSRPAPANGLSTYGGAWLATDTGNVGIGTTTTKVKLQVAGGLAVVDDSSNTTYDALAYFRNYSASDWGMIIDKNNANTYGLYIKSNGSYALSVTGGSRLQGSTCIGADAAAAYTCDVRGNVRATTEMRSDTGNFYAGSASGSQCHMQYDNSTKCMKFIFD